MQQIPRIALADYEQASPGQDARRRFCDTLRASLCEWGFVRVGDHGIDAALIARVYVHFERFFALPAAAKDDCGGAAGGQRGYTPFGVEHAKGHAAPDLKEFFHVGQEPAGDYPENRWPADTPDLREDALALFRELERCAARLLEALAEAFDLDRDRFAELVRGGNSILRAAHYPPVPPDADPTSVRAAAHEDINLITLLCEATDAGLEIRPPGSPQWLAVEALPGELVVDSGDMLSRMTNDVLPATTHRVVNPPGAATRHRYSLPFFAHPRPECDLSVLPRFAGPERPVRHPPITAGAFLDERLREIGLVS